MCMAMLADPLAQVRDPLTPLPYEVVAVTRETADVVSLDCTPSGDALELVAPGQFVMVWTFGVGEVPISVSRLGDDGTLTITVRAVGAVSAEIVRSAPGDVVGLRGPYGTGWPVGDIARLDTVMVAGGLGLAPLRMAIDALASKAPSQLTVVVGAREPAQLLYTDDLRRWEALGVRVHATVDAADRTWTGAVGFATAVLERLDEQHEVAFVCGPEPMMASAVRALLARGTRPDHAWVSLERNMHCGIAHCGRCQLGPLLLCRDGAVVRWDRAADVLKVRGR
jgi:anaerobic sulfite reductase subunit B